MSRRLPTDPNELELCTDNYGRVHRLDGEISRGGQGAVFRTKTPNVVVKFELKGSELVSDTENAKYMNLRFLPIPKGAHVTMPQATLKEHGGYIMQMMSDMIPFGKAFDEETEKQDRAVPPFVRTADKETQDFFVDYISSGGERRRLEAFMKSAALLAQLHAQGLVYCDYSPNNVFISKSLEYCNVWLIDADNLAYESQTLKGICFTPGLAAPEVFQFACEDSMCTPEDERVGRGNSFASDAYTFAVYLFKQLAGCHPFTGEAFLQAVQNADSPEEEFYLLQSGQFAYIADENDDSNRGHPFPLENVCSSELIALFQQTFCQEGRDNCLSRPGMNEWAVALARANDWALHCSGCGMDYVNESHHRCPWCDEPKPAVLTAESVCLARSSDAPPLWRFRRELSDECGIALPLRLAHGYDANELDKKLLTVSRENGELLVRIDVADPNLKVLFSEDKQSFAEYRTIKTVAKHFYLRCKNAARQTDVLVECGVSS